MEKERLKGNLDLLLLSVLAAGPRARVRDHHGAARAQRGHISDLGEGTVYPALHRLEAAGLLASDWAEAPGRKRRVYILTGKGAAALAAEQARWRRFAAGMQAVVGWSA